ncbi:PhnD/SsuA/transferrin family substrate-binding protein [Snodgrassella sp. ESL0253]|uniref:PhnD/SsuA/transferrin family substrate-binding protein n=1 Tax=Snodgrassella sp. ESL0253 TaxID=2705031 RepID=UPI001582B566|nr:PhnD/SsuA/transferrin family substrate-binding protein [Snodgrassella sp. ESL0253]NUE67055.1 phosphate/phosphite/phosphonate ABC transporter substrate-binding protein [Snodgrassella sp. ESL0253]
MTINFLIAPDFPPKYYAGWHFLNTRLQRLIDAPVHLFMPSNTEEEQQEIDNNNVDIIYANPFNASKLIRELGYLPVVRPVNRFDEMVIASAAESEIKSIQDIKPGMSILCTENYDVKLIALRLMEAVDIEEHDLTWIKSESFPAVARGLIQHEGDIGLFMSSAYHKLTPITLSRLNLLIESKINDLYHMILLHPRNAGMLETLQHAFSSMHETPAGAMLLEDLGLNDGFAVLKKEEAELLIDLIETLRD